MASGSYLEAAAMSHNSPRMLALPQTHLRLLVVAMLAATFSARTTLHAQELRAAIYVIKRDGSSLRKVAQVDGYKEHFRPAWSHDGKRLAFDALESGSQVK